MRASAHRQSWATLQRLALRLQGGGKYTEAQPALAAALEACARSPSAVRRPSLVRTWTRSHLGNVESVEAASALIRVWSPSVANSCATTAEWAESFAAVPKSRIAAAGPVWDALAEAAVSALEQEARFGTWWSRQRARPSLDEIARIACVFAVAAPPGQRRDQVLDASAVAAIQAGGHCSSNKAARRQSAWRRIAWACAAAGRSQDVFGEPDTFADAEFSIVAWKTLEQTASCEPSAAVVASGFASGNTTTVKLAKKPFPLLLFPAWLSPHEGEQLIVAAESLNLWEPSPLVDPNAFGGCSFSATSLRTSESAVLSAARGLKGEALELTNIVCQRAAIAFGLPIENFEPPQLVRYAAGARYAPHVDWGTADDVSLWLVGQRVGTALVYLTGTGNDAEGGATHFTKIGVRVSPKRGAALFWPNVDRSGQPLTETEHEAEPHGADVEHKVALNIWVRDRPLPRQW